MPDTSGRQEAEALRATGETFGTLGNIAQQSAELEMRKQRLRDESYLNKSAIKLREESTKAREDWQKDFEEDPLGKTEVLKSRLNEIKQSFLDQAPTGSAKHKMGIATDQYFLGVNKTAKDWEAKQVVALATKDADTGLKALQTEIYRSPTPANLSLLQQEANQVLSPLIGNIDPALVEEMKSNFDHISTITMFEGLVDKNRLGGAEKLLDSKKFDESLGVKGIRRIEDAIARKRRFNKKRQKNYDALKLKNPWGFLSKIGVTVQPLDFQNFDTQNFVDRTRLIRDMNTKHKIELPYLNPQEEDFFLVKLPKQKPDQQIAFLAQLNDIPDAEYFSLTNQVYAKSPTQGAVMGLVRDGSAQALESAKVISAGAILASKNQNTKGGGVNLPKRKDMDAVFDNYVLNAIRDPRLREAVKDSSYFHAVQKTFEANKLGQVVEEETFENDFKQSINEVVGQPFTVNNSTILPIRSEGGAFVDADYMDDLIQNITNENVQSTHGDQPRLMGGEPIDLDKAEGRLDFAMVGQDQYALSFDGQPLINKKNTQFIIDLKRLDKAPKDQRNIIQKLKDQAFDFLGVD